MPVIPLECPSCGTELRIDSDESAAICSRCGRPFVVKDAIVENYIKIVTEAEQSGQMIALDDFVIEDGVLIGFNGTFPNVYVPEGVTAIASKAFEDCWKMTEVRLPDSVKEIGENAFAGCSSLGKIYFSNSLTRIGSHAFSECTSLKELALPSSLKEIGPYAFSGCFMLVSVKMPPSGASIHETAFMGCKDLAFEWPDDWTKKQMDKLKLVAPTLGGLISLSDLSDTLLFLGMSYLDNKYYFYTYKDFMNLFSIDKNNNDPYLLRTSVNEAQQRYEAISDIQKSYSELIGLLDRAKIGRSKIETINIPHFIWKQGKRLDDYKIMDIGNVPVLQLKIVQE